MFKVSTIDFKDAGVLSPLVQNYLKREDDLTALYPYFPDKNGFAQLLKSGAYSGFNRGLLSDILLRQSERVKNSSGATVANIYKLKEKNTFTVTTGHQLCLFTGPLYFVYKIISTINLAEQLNREFPEANFVPVYWMASEDHDFAEINNFNLFGKSLIWESAQTGAVGGFRTEELKTIVPQLAEILGKSDNASHLLSLFERAYLEHNNLTDATRYLVNELLGVYGIITLDGDDKQFKQQFIDEFKKDIFDHAAAPLVNKGIHDLEKLGYTAQVNPREINCFYIEPGQRTRIEKKGEGYLLVGTEKQFAKAELEKIVETTPEKISPNVVLRPMYQQKILPNVAYTGGPGELAYWLEFKQLFAEFNITFPVLMPRNFISIVDKPTQAKIDKLNFSVNDFYRPENELAQDFQLKTNNVFAVEKEKEQLTQLYNSLGEKAAAIDKTLSGSLSGELQKSIKGLEMVTAKANRALKQRIETELGQIKGVKQKLFPSNVPQERYENFSAFYLKHGRHFIEEIKKNTDPFLFRQYIFTEK